MRRLALAAVMAVALAAPASAFGKTTADFTFKSTGKAAAPGAVAGIGADGTFEDIPFTIAPDEQDGTASIVVQWDKPADDFDLYVYRKSASGGLDQVGSSTSGPPNTSETVVLQAAKDPIPAGNYVIRVQNYASSTPDFTGSVKFGAFATPNVPPTAVFKAPATAVEGQTVTLDGSGSTDPDGHIVSYAWDLDGDGAPDVSGPAPTLDHAFSAGVRHLTLRVTDDRGARSYANATIRVTPATQAQSKTAHKKKKKKKPRRHSTRRP